MEWSNWSFDVISAVGFVLVLLLMNWAGRNYTQQLEEEENNSKSGIYIKNANDHKAEEKRVTCIPERDRGREQKKVTLKTKIIMSTNQQQPLTKVERSMVRNIREAALKLEQLDYYPRHLLYDAIIRYIENFAPYEFQCRLASVILPSLEKDYPPKTSIEVHVLLHPDSTVIPK